VGAEVPLGRDLLQARSGWRLTLVLGSPIVGVATDARASPHDHADHTRWGALHRDAGVTLGSSPPRQSCRQLVAPALTSWGTARQRLRGPVSDGASCMLVHVLEIVDVDEGHRAGSGGLSASVSRTGQSSTVRRPA
jgi:hypothetical protein